ncbi:hypothetical protein TrLO_g6303 [Triparma laevis f. longispina]|uniref:Uncharacterized protein n=1 Tax=Triparma laevis f. longispina TaxID=1714387 RepID=A0A9W7KZ97_9STRA|nr:hypothetical protein TrLO_g6303 [Triparma laevis f. longispina]
MFPSDFKRLLVGFVMGDTLMTLRLATKAWKRVADAFIDEGVKNGTMNVHDGNDISYRWNDSRWNDFRWKRNKLVTLVTFLLNVTKVGEWSCTHAANLVFVDIPEGVESIGQSAFGYCRSLTTVSFPITLISIGEFTFSHCSSLDNVDLLHTNLQELCQHA